jgi:hypothetical protein
MKEKINLEVELDKEDMQTLRELAEKMDMTMGELLQ